jgi:hypothetical protein
MSIRFLAATLALAACGDGDPRCATGSAEREALVGTLTGFVHRSQCPGVPASRAYVGEEQAVGASKEALLARIAMSPFKAELERAYREDAENSRFTNEADCSLPFQDRAEDPEAVKAHKAQLAGEKARIALVRAEFERLLSLCPEG